jgi:hypothetical protein
MAELSSFGWVFKSFCYMADKRTKYVALRLLVEMGKTNTYTHMDQDTRLWDQGNMGYASCIVHTAMLCPLGQDGSATNWSKKLIEMKYYGICYFIKRKNK